MYKITLGIDGMACSMCESHVNETIRKNFTVQKVTSNHKKNLCEIICEENYGEQAFRNALDPTGYRVISYQREPYVKKRFSLFG